MAAQEKLNNLATRTIAGWANTAKALWQKACEFDSIPLESRFVSFNHGNKYAEFYNLALMHYRESRQQFADGGYVGLGITDGKERTIK